jgi:Transposase DDE domain
VLTLQPGSQGRDLFPHARQAMKIVRRRRTRFGRWHTETVYAITSLDYRDAHPALLAAWVRGHWGIENRLHWVRDVTFDEDRSQVRTANGPQVMAACATSRSPPCAWPAGPTSPPACDTTPATRCCPSPPTD